jgi:hypothetical protein
MEVSGGTAGGFVNEPPSSILPPEAPGIQLILINESM